MSSEQGWFESDEDYRGRVAREADERTIEDSTESAPSQGWFEGDDSYRGRVAREANEHRIEDSTGSAPSQGWFEGDDNYRERIAQEANERIIEDSTGSAPSQGWLEGNDDYDTRIRKEANEQIVEGGTGSSPKPGWFEGDHDYRSRIAHEAREVRTRERSSPSTGSNSGFSSASSSATGPDSLSPARSESSGEFLWVVLLGGLIVGAYLLYSKSPNKPEMAQRDGPQSTIDIGDSGKPMNWASPPKLSLTGIGPMRIGMTLTEARSAAADQLIHDPSEGPDCFYVKPTGAPDGLAFMVTDGRISRVDITSPSYSSMSGARVGQTQDQVIQLYSGILEITEHKYDDNGRYLTYIPTDIADQQYRMVFETDGNRITRFRAGKLPEVQYVEGCL